VKLFTSFSVLSAVQVSPDLYDAEHKPVRTGKRPERAPEGDAEVI
jgi:hypothetical protein